MSVSAAERCEVVLGREKMETVKDFMYLATVLCKQRWKDKKWRELYKAGVYERQGLRKEEMCP